MAKHLAWGRGGEEEEGGQQRLQRFNRTCKSYFTLKAAQEANRYLRDRMADLIAELEDPGAREQREDDT